MKIRRQHNNGQEVEGVQSCAMMKTWEQPGVREDDNVKMHTQSVR